jgi:hypothetical protein
MLSPVFVFIPVKEMYSGKIVHLSCVVREVLEKRPFTEWILVVVRSLRLQNVFIFDTYFNCPFCERNIQVHLSQLDCKLLEVAWYY